MRERNKTIICILFIYKMHCNGCIKLIYTNVKQNKNDVKVV